MKIEELQSKKKDTYEKKHCSLSVLVCHREITFTVSWIDGDFFSEAKNTIFELHSNAIIFALECFTFFRA